MLKIVKIKLMCCMLFVFKCYAMESTFNRIVTENAINKKCLFERLRTVPEGEDKSLANGYLALYGEQALNGEERKKTLNSIPPFKRDKITSTAAYVVKALFGQTKRELYEVDMLGECIRVAELLLLDVPQLTSSRPMDNIGDILQASRQMLQTRNNVIYNIMKLQERSHQSIGLAAVMQ